MAEAARTTAAAASMVAASSTEVAAITAGEADTTEVVADHMAVAMEAAGIANQTLCAGILSAQSTGRLAVKHGQLFLFSAKAGQKSKR
jgi:hypothetical protein